MGAQHQVCIAVRPQRAHQVLGELAGEETAREDARYCLGLSATGQVGATLNARSLEATVRYLAYNLGPEGIRVNAVSAGPIKTLAAAGIGGFRKILGHVEENAPLRRTVTIEEVGNVAAFLCSDLASAVTGEVTYVDSGYNILGMTGLND